MMLILIKYHLELKKGVSNVIIEDLGGWRGRNVADFLVDLNQTHIASKTKKIRYTYPESTKIRLFSNFMMIFAYITSIFVGKKICLKIGFPWNFKGPQNLDVGVGTPTFFQEGSPGNNWPLKTPISMCGQQAHVQNPATNLQQEKTWEKPKKHLSFICLRRCTWCVHVPFFVTNSF